MVNPQQHGYNMIENIPYGTNTSVVGGHTKKQFRLLNEQTLTMGEESVYSDYGDYKTLTAEHSMGYDTQTRRIT